MAGGLDQKKDVGLAIKGVRDEVWQTGMGRFRINTYISTHGH
jgi:hypothetical protein